MLKERHITFSDIFFYGAILVSIGTIVTLFSSLTTTELGWFFSSDTLYLPSIYKDIFIDHNTIQGWHLNPAPNIFPDMIVYFLIMAVTSNFVITSFVFAIIQYVFFIYLIFRLFKAIDLPDPKVIAALSTLLLLLFFMVTFYSNDFYFTFCLVSNSYHTGAFLMSLWCHILAIEYLQHKQKKKIIYLLIISLLSVFSDRLFIVLYVIPWFLMVAVYFKIDQKIRLFLIILANSFSTVLGYIAFNLLKNSRIVFIDEAPSGIFKFTQISEGFKLLTRQMCMYLTELNFKTIIIVLSLTTLISIIVIAIRMFKYKPTFLIRDIYFVLSIIFTIFVFFAPVLNGKYTAFDHIRYNIYVFYLSIINSGIVIYYLIKKTVPNSTKILNYTIIIILLMGTSVNIIYKYNYKGIKNYFNYYPKKVEIIDEISKRENLYCGLGEYWTAKVITMFSKNGVRVYTSIQAFYIWDHVMNANWFKNSRFNFILSDNETQDSLITNYFNGNIKIIKSGNIRLIKTPEYRINPNTNKVELFQQ